METVYILLTRSTTIISRIVGAFTGDSYTHVSLACDDRLQTLCSFTRWHSAFPLPAGLMQEGLRSGYYHTHSGIPCALLLLSVDKTAYRALQKRIDRMLSTRKMYRYHVVGLLRCSMGFESHHPTKYFCSRFVAELLEESGAMALPKAPSLMRPQDFLGLPGTLCIYRGQLAGLNCVLPSSNQQV